MRLPLIVALVVLSAAANAEWSWDKKENSTSEPPKSEASTEANDAAASSFDFNFSGESDETGQALGTEDKAAEGRSLGSADIVEDILESGREGRALEGFSDVYNDPNVQEAIQAGNETSARSYIQERLCNLGLSSCDEEGPQRSVQPQELIYAQPVHIKPVGRPIAALPVRNPHAIRPYGPPRPMPLPSRPYPSYGAPGGHHGPPPPPPPGPYYHGTKVPPPPVYETPVHGESPYAFENQGFKKKGSIVDPLAAGGLQQHVHHHYHHAGSLGSAGASSNAAPSAALRPVYEAAAVGVTSTGGSSYAPSSSYSPGPVYPPLTQPFYKKELNLKAPIGNSIAGGSQYANRYPAGNYGAAGLGAGGDCYCVPIEQCPAHEILRKEDAASLIDPRNAPGAAGIEALDDVVVTDGNGTIISHHTKRSEQEKPEEKDASPEAKDAASSRRRRREAADQGATDGQARDVGLGLSAAAAAADPATENGDADADVAATDAQQSSGRALPDDEDAEGRQRTFGSSPGSPNAQVQPTFGVSFGLPNGGGGSGLYPFAAQGPFPFGNPALGGGSGLDLGPISVNPLLSVQVTKDQYGSKVVKPFVNLHVTPNAALVHKFVHGFHKPLFKHDHHHSHYIHHKYHRKPHFLHKPHYHYPSYAPHYHGYHSDDAINGFGPGSGPVYSGPGPVYSGQGPVYSGPPEPVYSGPPGPIYSGHGPVTGGYGLTYDQPGPEPLVSSSPISADHGPISAGPDPETGGYGLYDQAPVYKQPSGGYISDAEDLGQQSSPAYGYGNGYGYDSGYGYGYGDGNEAAFRSRDNRSLTFPEDGSGNDPPRPPKLAAPLPLMAKSDPIQTSKPIQFPSDRRSDRIRRQSERQYYGAPGGLGLRGQCGPRMVCCRRPGRVGRPQQQQHRGGQCGRRQAQGINGRIKNPTYVDGDSEFGEYPWQVAILKKDPNESVYVCGGTLIDSVHIITAAHCVKSYTGHDLRVRLGEWDVNHDVEFYPHIERDVAVVTVHPEFYAGTLYNDIAILRLVSPVDLIQSPHVSPACLPEPRADFSGSRCWTTGWGKDAFGDHGKYQNVLKEVDVPVMSHQQCQAQLQQTRLGYDFRLHQGFVCAGGEEGKDACKGDGGGPMVCERGGTWFVVGVVSWGVGCGQYGVPGVYVKVAHYIDWIRQVTNRN